MSPRTISDIALHHPPALHIDDTIETAVRAVLESKLPALPVVGRDERYTGIFGEREFLSALFPTYLGQLKSAAFLTRSIDSALEKREACREETVGQHMTREHVDVDENYSDTQIAEIFFHHRVLIIPVVANGHLHGVITRRDFFRALAERFLARPDS